MHRQAEEINLQYNVCSLSHNSLLPSSLSLPLLLPPSPILLLFSLPSPKFPCPPSALPLSLLIYNFAKDKRELYEINPLIGRLFSSMSKIVEKCIKVFLFTLIAIYFIFLLFYYFCFTSYLYFINLLIFTKIVLKASASA